MRFENKYVLNNILELSLFKSVLYSHKASFNAIYKKRKVNNFYFDTWR